jgi:tetratricopeptide (TPR) repeat protein
MVTKKKLRGMTLTALLLITALAGCTPAGPGALLDGKKLIEKGKYDAAIERLKVATELMDSNALAWNYLGLAYHHANRPADAIEAYRKALKRNPDLLEVHYDLGCVLLDENRPEQLESARNEFTTYTLRRSKSVDGWLKLGTAQLRLGELGAAEKSFNEVRLLNPQNAEALNDLGVALLRRNQARDAATYFSGALQQQPGYAPALLNLAMVSQTHLNNRRFALEKYREYLALNPRPANWEAVNATAHELEQELNPPPVAPPQRSAPPTNLAKLPTNVPTRVGSVAAKPEAAPKPVAIPPKPAPRPEVVQVADTTEVKVANDTQPPQNDTAASANVLPGPLPSEQVVASPPDATNEAPKPEKRGFFQRINPMNLFRRSEKPAETPASAPAPEPTPKPAAPPAPGDSAKPAQVSTIPENVSPAPVRTAPPAKPVQLVRYSYKSPARPQAGDRAEAERLFAQGAQAYRDHRLKDAVTAYRAAVQADPAYFEAQSNLGLAAFDAGDLPQSLTAYETALAIKPGSFNTRFNFALALSKGGYIQDAAIELERLLATAPADEPPASLAMAHLTLANLYAEQFHQSAAARPHYLKVLELDPHNSQATAIRYWLRDNS